MTVPDPEVEKQIAAMQIRAGSPADLRQRDRALNWLLQNEERSFPVVLSRAAVEPDDLAAARPLERSRDALGRGLSSGSRPRTRVIALDFR